MAAGVDAISVGKMSASSLKASSAPSIPRVAPRSLSAARASKKAWSTVVFSAAMNLVHRGQFTTDYAWYCWKGVLRLISPEGRDELLVRVRNIERDQVC